MLVPAEFLHVKPGKGAAFVRTKLKNFITGNVVDKTFRGGESVDAATVEKKETQFSYVDGDDVRALWLLLRCLLRCHTVCNPKTGTNKFQLVVSTLWLPRKGGSLMAG